MMKGQITTYLYKTTTRVAKPVKYGHGSSYLNSSEQKASHGLMKSWRSSSDLGLVQLVASIFQG